MVGCWKRGSSWGPGWKQPQHWGRQSAEEGRRREEQVVNGRAGGAAGRGPGDPGLAPGVGNPVSREGQRGRVGLGETLRGRRWGPCVRSGPRARRKVLQRSKKREEAGRRLRPRWSAGHSPDASLAAHAGGRKAVSDPQGCGSGAEAQPPPLAASSGTRASARSAHRGRPRPQQWPRSLPRMLGRRWQGEAASGAPTPPLVSSAEPEDGSLGSRPSCAVWLRDPAAGLGRGARVPPPGPPAHSRVSLPTIPLQERPAGRGVSATGGGAGYNQSQAGNSSRGALAGLREWGGGGGCCRRGGWQSARTSPPPPPPSPPPASWKLGRRPTPWLHATFLPLGAGGTRRPGSPLWAGPRGAQRISEPAS